MDLEPISRKSGAPDAPPSRAPLDLRLYVAGSAPNSLLAEANLRSLLARSRVEYALEIIDCIREPLRALQDGVFVTPMLLKLRPEPATSIVGSLRDTETVSSALGLRIPSGGPANG